MGVEMNHIEFWVESVERMLGHSLDGNQELDGYSLDYAFDAFEGGVSALLYARGILDKEFRRNRLATGENL